MYCSPRKGQQKMTLSYNVNEGGVCIVHSCTDMREDMSLKARLRTDFKADIYCEPYICNFNFSSNHIEKVKGNR